MRRIWRFLALGLAMALFLASCGRRGEKSAEEILREICEAAGELPEGAIYRLAAEEGEADYLSPQLVHSLYGEEGDEILASKILADAALYLSSFASPYEIAVFHTYSRSDADSVAAMCLSRADELQVARHRTEWESLVSSLRIVVRGRWVVVLVTDNQEEAEAEVLRLLR